MAARPRRRPAPVEERRLSVAEAQFYARVFGAARKGSLAELRRRGCTEQEAEEVFAAAYAGVMEAVDPIERRFSAPQMVGFVKRACWRRLIDERRRRARCGELQARAPAARPGGGAESPAELAEEREAVAIGREALAMLPERERAIFRQRHVLCLTPEEIVRRTPGLSMRSYRKLIQRANARVLEAFERIEAGERCAEIEGPLLRRYVAGESPPAERRALEAHLAHCRVCQAARAQMRGYLIDVAAGTLLASSLAGGGDPAAAGDAPVRLVELASHGAHLLGEATRGVRERLREALLKLPVLPGADAGAAQALGATSVRIASACTAGIAAGACVAAGVVPWIGGIGASGHHHARPAPAARRAPAPSAPLRTGASETASPSQPRVGPDRASPSASARRSAPAKRKPRASPAASAESPSSQSSPSSARVSGRQTGTEFGAESIQPAPSSGSSSPSSSSSQGSSASSGATAGSGGSSASSKTARESSAEFGM